MNPPTRIRQPLLSFVRLAWIILASYNALSGLLLLPAYYRQLVSLNPWPNQSGWTQATFSAAVGRTGLEPQLVAWIVLLPTLVCDPGLHRPNQHAHMVIFRADDLHHIIVL